jgi:50S ribosomal subunit-associated GTPase HflX
LTTRALVVHPDRPRPNKAEGEGAYRLEEAIGLARAIGLRIVHSECLPLNKSRPATLIGAGSLERLAGIVAGSDAELVVFDATLTPVQQRNLERALGCKVIDRTGLILEIFGERARTKGKASCKSSWPRSAISDRVWCGPGPTWNAKGAGAASWAALANARSSSTAA